MNKNQIKIQDKPLNELSIGQRRQFARDRLNHKGDGRAYKQHDRRPVQPQTAEDFKSLKALLVGSAAVVGLGMGINNFSESSDRVKPVESGITTETTIAIAGEGDSYSSLQAREGFSGEEEGDVVFDATELPENDDNNDGVADPIHPGSRVALIDDPSTPIQP